MNKENARNLLRQFDFKAPFLNELGWDDHQGTLPLKMGEDTISLDLAVQRGLAGYHVSTSGFVSAALTTAMSRSKPILHDYRRPPTSSFVKELFWTRTSKNKWL